MLTLDQLEGLKDPNIEYWGTEEDNDGDPPRLWAPNATYPGTAFTRSVGDSGACRGRGGGGWRMWEGWLCDAW